VDRTVLLCMENITRLTPLKQPIVFELEGFDVPPGHGSLFFILLLFHFILVLLANGVVAFVIIKDKTLHRPMFIMVCHLVACDLLGGTAVLPRIAMQFLGQKKIAYASAITQAFCVHTYGTSMQTILGVMAYDRYVAVCEPLRYPTIMTSTRVHISCAVAWIVALVLIGVLFAFHINVPLCGTVIKHAYSNNRDIMLLACGPTTANSIYGLAMSWVLSASVCIIVGFSYSKILHASVKRRRTGSSINSKAFRTCAIHVAIFLIYQTAALVIIVSHRIPSTSANTKKFLSALLVIVPPVMDPMIYGLVSKELRESIIKHLCKQCYHRK
ncbi:olfactory receptor 13C9-like, partial [Antennarius striatus]|uniref:olfactory receptor 13C9-like n=1 Tax=Antennarius striatus TaxID=241820 RepID=UPI0035B351CE